MSLIPLNLNLQFCFCQKHQPFFVTGLDDPAWLSGLFKMPITVTLYSVCCGLSAAICPRQPASGNLSSAICETSVELLIEIRSRPDSTSPTTRPAIFAKLPDKYGSLDEMEKMSMFFSRVRLA
ncbi:MAG: hypothetical protein DWI02_02050 [Planctomycetota bacterium]|nr:MAG: hypothetical protein DWI02_02050 [Planctomycetota bacterium]